MVPTAQWAEDAAREWWRKTSPEVTAAGYDRRAALIVASDQLATAVAALLSEHGVVTEVGPVRRDPALPGAPEVMCLVGQHTTGVEVIIPIMPAEPSWRIYPHDRGASQSSVDLADPLETITAHESTRDGWVPAATIAMRLKPCLR